MSSRTKTRKVVEQKKNVASPNPQQLVHAQTYGTINEAVHEYLLKSGLFRTVDTFQVSFSFIN
jgi:hypothetical protein